ncbi:MAG: Gldg family protein [Clostridia bacterium]|nr:Gldg family protein [Clostridia bacterium]
MKNSNSTVKGFLDNEKTASGILTAALIATVIALNVVIFALANIFTLSFTAKEKDQIVLTGNTDSLFEEAISEGKKVTIFFCFPNESDLESHETGVFVHKTAKEYESRYDDFIDIEYINLITGVNSRGEDVSEKIVKWEKDENGNANYLAKGSVVFECGDNYKVVTDTISSSAYADFYTLDSSGNAIAYNGEAFMASMINWVTVDEHKTAYFTVGHSEQLDSTFANILVCAGYVLNTVDLKNDEIPADAGLLIISNPLSDFEKGIGGARKELERLNDYVKDGGNIYVALDPYVGKMPVLEGFLAENGIAFSETDDNGTTVRNIIKDPNNAITSDGFTLVADFADNDTSSKIADSVNRYSDGSVIIREAAALKLSGSAVPVLVSTPSSTLEANGERVDDGGSYAVAACAKIRGDRNKIASLCVVSSVYISVSDALVTNGYSNADFMYSLFDNFYGRGRMPYGCDIVKFDNSMLENLTMGKAKMYTALILAVPVIIAGIGAVIVIKRKNR